MNVEPVNLGDEFGSALSFASTLRQSYSPRPVRASACTVASCTPCDWSATVSRSGQRVAFMCLRNSTSSESGTSTRNGRMALSSTLDPLSNFNRRHGHSSLTEDKGALAGVA